MRRPPRPGDLARYAELAADPDIGAALRPPPADQWHERDLTSWRAYRFGPWLLWDGGRFAGRAGLQRSAHDEVEVVWALLTAARGRGLATAAGLAAIELARERGVDEVVALTLATNLASLRVIERLGMSAAGEVEHAGLAHLRYRLRVS